MSLKLASIAAVSVGLLGVQAATAQYVTIASDDFSSGYTAGSTVTAINGGTGWSAAWTGNYGIASSTSMTYSDGVGGTMTSAGSMNVSGTTGAGTPQRLLPGSTTLGSLCTTYGGSIYVSFLYQDLNPSSGDASGYYRQQGFALYQGTSEYLDVGLPNIGSANKATVSPNFSLWGANKGIMGSTLSSTAPLASSPAVSAASGSVELIVMKLTADTSATTGDSISVWINPTLGADGYADLSGSANLVYSSQDLSGITSIRFPAGNVSANYGTLAGNMNIGDVNVYTVAVPEPGTLALAMLGGLSLLAVRSRKQK